AEESAPSGEREESVPSSASPPPWAVFVIGLDEAIERSRDACGKILSDGAGQVEREEVGDAAGERLEWRRPIIPTAEGRRQPDRAEGSSSGVGPAAIDRAPPSGEADSCRPLPSRLSGGEEPVARPGPEAGSPHDAGDGRPLTEGAVPLAWAASGSALIAGWFWARRRLRQGWGLGRSGRKGHRRGGRDDLEEGPRPSRCSVPSPSCGNGARRGGWGAIALAPLPGFRATLPHEGERGAPSGSTTGRV